MINLDPFKEYVVAFKWMLGVGFLLGVLCLGIKIGHSQNDDVIATQSKTIAIQRMALQAQATKIREINRNAAAAIAAAKTAQAEADKAGTAAENARRYAFKQISDYDKKLRAARKKPDCEALLKQDVRQLCGL